MTTDLIPTPNALASTVAIPAPAESVTSASVALYVQKLIDAIAFLNQRVPGARDPSSPIDLSYPPTFFKDGGSDWSLSTLDTVQPAFYQNSLSTGSGFGIVCPLDSQLLTGQVIRGFSLDFIGKNGHAALPVTMPQVKLIKYARGVGSASIIAPGLETTIDSQVDTSATTSAYQVMHTIGKTLAAPETVNKAAFYYSLQVIGEYGTNAITGSVALEARILVSR